MIWEVAARQKPWVGYTIMQILNVVGNQNKTLVMPLDSSATMLSLFTACCNAKPADRCADHQPFLSFSTYAADLYYWFQLKV